MVDLNRRIRTAAESILENEALRGGLGDEQAATTLLNWGIACAEKLTLETENIEDDEEADEAIYPRMKALRKLLGAVSEIAATEALEISALQGSIAAVFEFAQRIHGEGWQPPDLIDDETWLVLLNGNSLERINKIRALIEPPEALPQTSNEVVAFSEAIEEDKPIEMDEQANSTTIQRENIDKGDDDVTFFKHTPI